MCELKSILWTVLNERIYFFERNGYKRNDAIGLILMSNCCWQIFRDEHKIGDKSKESFCNFYKIMLDKYRCILEDPTVRDRIEDPERVTKNTYEEVTKDSAKRKFDSLNEIFKANTVLRHPNNKEDELQLLLQDPWPDDKAKNLLEASKLLKSLN